MQPLLCTGRMQMIFLLDHACVLRRRLLVSLLVMFWFQKGTSALLIETSTQDYTEIQVTRSD